MGRRAKRHRRSPLQLAHPAEGVALSVAGLLVIATLWTGYQRSDDQQPTPAVPSAVPTQALGEQDVASYPSVLLQPSPEPPVGTGVTLDTPDPERARASTPASRTASPPATTTASDPSPSSTSRPSPPATAPTSPPSTSPAPPTVAPTAPSPPATSPTSSPTTPSAPPDPPAEPTAPEAPPADQPSMPDRGGATGQGSAPGAAARPAPESADPAAGR